MTPTAICESESYRPRSPWLTLRALLALARVDLALRTGGFKKLYRTVKNCRVSSRTPDAQAVGRICAAVNEACSWYITHALCLQRSAAATYMLRKAGVPATMVIAARKMPFHGHAWVEVEGIVVNDEPKVQEFYSVLDRL